MPTEPSKADPPNRKRRWYQFSVRTLMIFVTLVGCGLGWLGFKGRAARRQQATHVDPGSRLSFLHVVAQRRLALLDEVPGHLPLPVFIEHRRDRLDGRFLVLKRRVELNDDVLAIGSTGQAGSVFLGLEFPRFHFAQRFSGSGQSLDEIFLARGILEESRC